MNLLFASVVTTLGVVWHSTAHVAAATAARDECTSRFTVAAEVQRLAIAGRLRAGGDESPAVNSLLKIRPILLRVAFPTSICSHGVLSKGAQSVATGNCSSHMSGHDVAATLQCRRAAFPTPAAHAQTSAGANAEDKSGQTSFSPEPTSYLIPSLDYDHDGSSRTSIADMAAALFAQSTTEDAREWTVMLLPWDIASAEVWDTRDDWIPVGDDPAGARLSSCTLTISSGLFTTNGEELCGQAPVHINSQRSQSSGIDVSSAFRDEVVKFAASHETVQNHSTNATHSADLQEQPFASIEQAVEKLGRGQNTSSQNKTSEIPRGFFHELSPAHVKLNAMLKATLDGLREVGDVNLALAAHSQEVQLQQDVTKWQSLSLVEAGTAERQPATSASQSQQLPRSKRLMYDQARKLQLSLVEVHSRAEALLRAGVHSKEIFAIIVDLIMNMAPTIICSMIVSVLAPPLIQIVGEILGCILTPILLPGSKPQKCPTTLGKKRKMLFRKTKAPCQCRAPLKNPEFQSFLERQQLDAAGMQTAEIQAACERMCDAEARLGGSKYQLDGLRRVSPASRRPYGTDGFSSAADVVDTILQTFGSHSTPRSTSFVEVDENTPPIESPEDVQDIAFVEVEAKAGSGVTGPQAIVMMLMSQEFPPALDAIITPALHQSISHNVIANLRRELPASTTRRLHSSLLGYLTNKLTSELSKPLLASLASGLTLHLTRLLTKVAIPAITHAVTPAVSFAITHSPKGDYYCYFCDAHRVYCSLCDQSRHDTAYLSYAANYYSSYYSNYYQDFYGDSNGWANAMTMEYFNSKPPILP